MEIKRLVVGELATNCYLLVSGNEMAVIDPGGDAPKILEEIKGSSAKVKYIIITHEHFDHVLAVQEVKQRTKAETLAHQSSSFQCDRSLSEGEEIKIGDTVLTVLHTPGHTRDSISLLGPNFIFTGDTLFCGGIGRTDFPGASEKDLIESIKEKILIFDDKTIIYPGHGPCSTIGRERRKNSLLTRIPFT